MRQLNVIDWETRRALAPDDLAGWQLRRDAQLAQQTGPSEQTAAREGVSLTDMTLGASGDRGDRLKVLAGFTVTETPAQQ
jgi:hypothetical protein